MPMLKTFAQQPIIEWGDKNEQLKLNASIRLLVDTLGYSIEDVQNKAFVAPKESNPLLHIRRTSPICWVKFAINNSSATDLLLEIEQGTHEDVRFFYQEASGNWKTIKSGYKVALKERGVQSHFPAFMIPKVAGVQEYFLRIEGGTGVTPIKIWHPKAHQENANYQKIIYGICIGLFMFTLLYTLFLFLSSGQLLFLAFALYSFVVAVSNALDDGYALYFTSPLDMFYWELFFMISMPPLGTILCLLFLETHKYTPKWNKLMWAYVIYLISYLFWFPQIGESQGVTLHNQHIQINIILQVLTCILVGLKGNRLGFYLIAIVLIVRPISQLQTSYLQTGSPELLYGISYYSLATIIQTFIIMFLFAKKLDWDKTATEKAKLEVQKELVVQAQEHTVIVEEKNELLQTANQKIREVSQAKQEFLAVVSHELRTPMNAIMGFTELLKIYEPITDDQQFCIDNMDTSSKNMLRMIDNILSLLDLDSKTLDKTEFDIHDVLFQVMKQARAENEKPDVMIKLDISPNLVRYVLGDPICLKQIFTHLMSNALKFTEKGSITLRAKSVTKDKEQVCVHFSVEDTGIGIPKEKQAKIFDAFSQASGSYNRDYDGLGIGLPLCKRFLELHNSDIAMESVVGQGSKFYFSINYPLC